MAAGFTRWIVNLLRLSSPPQTQTLAYIKVERNINLDPTFRRFDIQTAERTVDAPTVLRRTV